MRPSLKSRKCSALKAILGLKPGEMIQLTWIYCLKISFPMISLLLIRKKVAKSIQRLPKQGKAINQYTNKLEDTGSLWIPTPCSPFYHRRAVRKGRTLLCKFVTRLKAFHAMLGNDHMSTITRICKSQVQPRNLNSPHRPPRQNNQLGDEGISKRLDKFFVSDAILGLSRNNKIHILSRSKGNVQAFTYFQQWKISDLAIGNF